MLKVTEIVVLLFLACAAYTDLKKGTVNIIYVLAGAVVGIGIRVFTGYQSTSVGWYDMLSGASVGLGVLIIAYASRQAIGYGDGILLAATGVYLGGLGNSLVFLLSLLLSSVCSALLMLLKLKNRKDSIPFIPFMLGGYILYMGVYG